MNRSFAHATFEWNTNIIFKMVANIILFALLSTVTVSILTLFYSIDKQTLKLKRPVRSIKIGKLF